MQHQPTLFTHRQKILFAILVNIMAPLGGMSTDIYLPSLPALAVHFHSTKALAQLTVTAFVLSMAVMQLVAGPISDAIGRKKLLVMAMIVQLFAIVMIVISPNVSWMMAFRLLQGIGVAFMMVPMRAVLNDVFEGVELKKMFNVSTISFALGPIIAPFIGGYMQHYFGWQASFGFLFVYGFLMLCVMMFVYRETIPEKRTFSMHHLWKNYHTILQSKRFVFSAVLTGSMMGFFTLFTVSAPFLVQVVMHYSAITYGHLGLLMGVAWFMGNMTNRVFFHFNDNRKTQLGLVLIAVIALAMVVLARSLPIGLMVLVGPVFCMVWLSGMIFPIYVSECLSMFPKLAASGNACLFGIVWLVFGVYTVLAAVLKANTLMPLAFAYFGVSVLCLGLYYGFLNR